MSSACISVYVMKFVKNYSLCLVINRPYNNKIKSSGEKTVCLIHWLLVILNVCFIVVCLATGDLKKNFEQADNFFIFPFFSRSMKKKILRKFSANITSLWKHKTPHRIYGNFNRATLTKHFLAEFLSHSLSALQHKNGPISMNEGARKAGKLR